MSLAGGGGPIQPMKDAVAMKAQRPWTNNFSLPGTSTGEMTDYGPPQSINGRARAGKRLPRPKNLPGQELRPHRLERQSRTPYAPERNALTSKVTSRNATRIRFEIRNF